MQQPDFTTTHLKERPEHTGLQGDTLLSPCTELRHSPNTAVKSFSPTSGSKKQPSYANGLCILCSHPQPISIKYNSLIRWCWFYSQYRALNITDYLKSVCTITGSGNYCQVLLIQRYQHLNDRYLSFNPITHISL